MNESGTIGKAGHTIQYFMRASYHMYIFNMAYVGVCKCDCMSFPSWPAAYEWDSQTNNYFLIKGHWN